LNFLIWGDVMERKVRGSILNSYMGFVTKKWGKDGYRLCMSDIGLWGEFRDGNYYQDAIRENILRWMAREKGEEYLRECGKYIATNLGILSWLVRFADPKTIASKFPKNFSEIYSYGKMETITDTDGVIILKLYELCRIKECCEVWHGVCEGILESTKTKGTVEEVKCSIDGAQYCEFKITY
jgi:predicted hydrocarbon binding protein